MTSRWSRERWWRLLEPTADRPEVARVLERVLDLADGAPTIDGFIDIESPGVSDVLDRHRVMTVIPPEFVDPCSRDVLRTRQIEIGAARLRLRHAATTALGALDRAGLDARVLKGLATAELDHRDPQVRHTGDVDLAVAPEQLDDAVRVLREVGCRDHPTPFDPVLWYGRTLVTPDDIEIDLHTRLFRRSPLGRSLVEDPGVPLAALPGTALPAEQRLVHAAGHFIIWPPGERRMNGFLDIGRLLDRPDLDLDGARRFARRVGVESLVGAGIRVEAELSGRREVLDALETWEQPDWFERQTRLVVHRRLVLDHLGRYREVPAGHRLEYLPSWLLPTARQRQLLRTSATSAASRVVARTPLRRRWAS